MKATFCDAQEKDLPLILKTYNSTIPLRMVTADTEPVSLESRKEWFRNHKQQNRPVWIINVEDEYAGWMAFSSFYGRPAYSGTAELSIYLEEDFRGKGIGSQCIHYAMEQARKTGLHTLLAFVFGHNEASIRLFTKEGFHKWGFLPEVAVLNDRMSDLVILGRKCL